MTISSKVIAGTPGEVDVGGYLREAKLDGLNGRSKKLSDYKGKPLIINVWASWCGPCRAEMDSLEHLARRYNGRQFNVIGISTDDDGKAAKAFIKQANISFANYLDHNLVLENMLGANSIPLTLLIDAKGRVVQKARGAYDWNTDQTIDAIGDAFRIKLRH